MRKKYFTFGNEMGTRGNVNPVRCVGIWCAALFLIGFMLSLSLSLKADETANPNPKEWQIEGALAAFEDSIHEVQALALNKLYELKALNRIPKHRISRIEALLKDQDDSVRTAAVRALGHLAPHSQDYIPQIVNLLSENNWNTRTAAVETLKTLKDRDMGALVKDYIPDIADLLEENIPSVRADAVELLGHIGSLQKEYISQIAALLKDKEPSVRMYAAGALGNLGESAADYIPQIVPLLGDDKSPVRSAAAWALGDLSQWTGDYIPRIAAFLNDKDLSVRISALEALGRIGKLSKKHIPQIAAFLNDRHWSARAAAVEALGHIGTISDDYIQRVVKLLDDKDTLVRSAAAKTLDELSRLSLDYFPHIEALLKDESFSVANSALVSVLTHLGKSSPGYIPRIAALLKDKKSSTRSTAAWALGNLPALPPEHIPHLANLLNDNDSSVRSAAVNALGNQEALSEDYVSQIAALLSDPLPIVRVNVVRALSNQARFSEKYIPRIAALLKDPDLSVRAAAVQALGNMGQLAGDIIPEIAALLDDADGYVRSAAVETLGKMGPLSKDYILEIVALLNDVDPSVRTYAVEALGKMDKLVEDDIKGIVFLLDVKDANVRTAAVEALGNLGTLAKNYVPRVMALLNDEDERVRTAASYALLNLGKVSLTQMPHLLNEIYENSNLRVELRFLAHLLGGGSEDVEILLKCVGDPDTISPSKITYDDARKNLQVFDDVWEATSSYPRLRVDLAEQIAVVVSEKNVTWKTGDLPLLENHLEHLDSVNPVFTPVLQEVIDSLAERNRISPIIIILLLHVFFWLILMFAYPKYPMVQAIFFWNRYVRIFMGLGYIHFALILIPYLRRKLFEPFRYSLLADAALDDFNKETYFEESGVRPKNSQEIQPIKEAIPRIEGQVILEGESGLGKSMFLRCLAAHSKHILVYLPAEKCSKGIMEAIRSKLHPIAVDERFLKSLVFNGAMDIFIDGLNEVSVEARQQIGQFAETYHYCNIIMTTQPIEWVPPAAAKSYVLLPLRQSQIQEYLVTRQWNLPGNSNLSGFDYRRACERYLAKALSEDQPPEMLESTQSILSNPMDLDMVAWMLALKQEPDILNLQEQQYKIMAKDYEILNTGRKFPLEEFSETVYRMRLNDEYRLPKDKFIEEIRCMRHFKMVLSHQSVDADGNPTKGWYFRHDKIMAFFIVQTFLGNNDRTLQHISDDRFRGVYFQLANFMPYEAAMSLREKMVEYAADTGDHTLSDLFIRQLKIRRSLQIGDDDLHIKNRSAANDKIYPEKHKEDRERKYIRNPYLPGRPTSDFKHFDRLFVGREDVIKFIKENVVDSYSERIVVLYGQRRSGKTWTLLHLKEHPPKNYLPLYIDVQAFTALEGIPAVLQIFASEIVDIFNEWFSADKKALSNIRVPTLDQYKKNYLYYFEKIFLKDVQKILGKRKLLWMFDEFQGFEDMVNSNNIPSNFMDFLRHLMQFGKNMTFIFAGTQEMTEKYYSVFFNIAVHRKIGIIKDADAEKLIVNPVKPSGVKYEQLAISRIKQLTGNHPYFIQLLCDRIVSELNTSQELYVDKSVLQNAVKDLVYSGESNIKFHWTEIMDEKERAVAGAMQDLVNRRKPADVGTIWNDMKEINSAISPDDVSLALNSLCEKDLLEKIKGSRDTYKFKIGLVENYIDAHVSYSETRRRIRKLW